MLLLNKDYKIALLQVLQHILSKSYKLENQSPTRELTLFTLSLESYHQSLCLAEAFIEEPFSFEFWIQTLEFKLGWWLCNRHNHPVRDTLLNWGVFFCSNCNQPTIFLFPWCWAKAIYAFLLMDATPWDASRCCFLQTTSSKCNY